MAYYALAQVEKELGYQLSWREQRQFIIDFVEENYHG